MANIGRFEDLEVWRKARELIRAVYASSNEEPFSGDFGLHDQIRWAVVSVMSNIAEGFERLGDVELRRFLSIARGWAGEVKVQLYVALDAGLIDNVQFNSLTRLQRKQEVSSEVLCAIWLKGRESRVETSKTGNRQPWDP